MRPIPQRDRFLLMVGEALIILGISWAIFDWPLPPDGNRGFWFYSALLGLLLGARLDTPFFAKPADVFSYAAPAATTLLLCRAWQNWDEGVRVAWVGAFSYCLLAALSAVVAILTFGSKIPFLQRVSNAGRIVGETLGAPRALFTVVLAFAVFAFHRASPKEVGLILGGWILTGVFSPLEAIYGLTSRLKGVFRGNTAVEADGEIVGHQIPGLVLIR